MDDKSEFPYRLHFFEMRIRGNKSNGDVTDLHGELVAVRGKAAGVEKVVFDKNGFIYHKNGRVATLADGARKAGLDF